MAMPKRDNIVEVSETTKNRYFKNLSNQIHQLRLAMEKSDNESVREICHRVRGSASLFGLKELGDACRDVEEAILANNPERIVEGFQIIEVIVGRNLNSAEAS
jgi:HPt (histidine-containing phosphotransfer) domain-containing protein